MDPRHPLGPTASPSPRARSRQSGVTASERLTSARSPSRSTVAPRRMRQVAAHGLRGDYPSAAASIPLWRSRGANIPSDMSHRSRTKWERERGAPGHKLLRRHSICKLRSLAYYINDSARMSNRTAVAAAPPNADARQIKGETWVSTCIEPSTLGPSAARALGKVRGKTRDTCPRFPIGS
jgi:hypothetical protein